VDHARNRANGGRVAHQGDGPAVGRLILRGRSRSPLLPNTALGWTVSLTLVAALATVAWEAANVHQIQVGKHCGYDGQWYCAMAEGKRAISPYQRRFFLPMVVRAIHYGNVVSRFSITNLAACFAIAVLTGLLTRRFAQGLGARADRARTASVFAGALTLLAVFPLRFTFMVPVNTDVAGAAFVLGWLWVVTGKRAQWLSPLLATAAVLTRDMGAPALLAAVLVMLVMDRERWLLALVTAFGVCVAAYLTTLVPVAPGPSAPGVVALARTTLPANFSSLHGFVVYAWLGASGLGLVALLAIPTLRRLAIPAFATAWTLVLVGGAIASSLGLTTDRYLLLSMPVLTALAAAHVASSPRWDVVLAVLAAATVALWRPWVTLSGNAQQILRIYDPYLQPWTVNSQHLMADLRNMAVATALAGLFVVVAGSRRMRAAAT
jgi:hypothetical protein